MDKLLIIINSILENKGEEKINTITREMSLRDEVGLDSIDLAELTAVIEAEFDVDVFEYGIVSSIGEILDKIENKKSQDA